MRYFVLTPVLFGLGIGLYFLLPSEPSYLITLGFLESLIILAIIWRYYPQRLLILGLIACVGLGFANIQLRAMYLSQNKPLKQEKVIYISGQISYKDYNSRGAPRYTLIDVKDLEDNKIFEKIKISVPGSKFMVGQCVETVAKLMPPPKTSFYGSFDFGRKAFFEGLQANGFALAHAYEIECPKSQASLIDAIRDKIIAKIAQILPKSEAGIVSALIAGEQGKISKKLLSQYRDSGLAHVLSVSGLHMSMIAGLMFLLIRTLLNFFPAIGLRFDIKKISAFFAILLAAFYLMLSGAQIPTQRAFIMVLIVLLGVLFDRKAISMQTIAVAALVVLIISPQALISASFQMSFAAVLCLIAFYEKFADKVYKFTHKFGFVAAYILGLVIADLVASVATLPFAIYHFNRIAIYTTLGNLLAGPIIGIIIMPFVLLSLLLMPFNIEVLPLKVVGYGVGLMNDITKFVSSLDYAGLQVLSMPFWGFLLIIGGGIFLCLWQGKIRMFGLGAIIVGFLSMATVEKPISVNLEEGSKFEQKLVEQKYGKIHIKKQNPYGAVLYKNKIKTLNFKRIWH